MQTMNISLPDATKQYKAKEQLEETLLGALNSDEPFELTPQMWDELRQNIRARAKASHSQKP